MNGGLTAALDTNAQFSRLFPTGLLNGSDGGLYNWSLHVSAHLDLRRYDYLHNRFDKSKRLDKTIFLLIVSLKSSEKTHRRIVPFSLLFLRPTAAAQDQSCAVIGPF